MNERVAGKRVSSNLAFVRVYSVKEGVGEAKAKTKRWSKIAVSRVYGSCTLEGCGLWVVGCWLDEETRGACRTGAFWQYYSSGARPQRHLRVRFRFRFRVRVRDRVRPKDDEGPVLLKIEATHHHRSTGVSMSCLSFMSIAAAFLVIVVISLILQR